MNRLFEISRRALQTHSAAINTTGQNIANASTPGFNRRRLILQSESVVTGKMHTQALPGTFTGAGVSAQSYERVRDQLLSSETWGAQTGLGSAEEEHRILSALEGVLATGTDGSLSAVLGDFWDALGNLADYPTDTGLRENLLSQADALATTLQRHDQAFETLQEQTYEALTTGVETVNGLLEKIGTLNETIQSARFKGSPDLSAEDQRDVLVQELSAYVPLRVQQDAQQGYTLTIQGMEVVQGNHVAGLALEDPPGPTPRVLFENTDVAFKPTPGHDGKLGAWLRLTSDILPGVVADLDTFTQNLVEQVNTLHRDGFDLDGNAGGDFFDAAGLTAGTIEIALADPRLLAVAGAADAPGDNAAALAILGLRSPFDDAAVTLVAGVGASVADASSQATAQTAVADHLEAMARGVSGVSLDEEMANLIQHQQAFAAAARILNTAQEMMDTLLAL
jgi:flagellar hook-associated protein 1 FlgK